MRLPGRLRAAIEVLTDIEQYRRPASVALKDWGLSHRFAGAADRAAIGNIVYDGLRRKLSYSHVAGGQSARGLAFATLICGWGENPRKLNAGLEGDKFAPEPLNDAELRAFETRDPLAAAPAHVQADIPAWTQELFENNFDNDWIEEGRALSDRPPLDMRVNTLKAERDKVLRALARSGARPTTIATCGMRIEPGGRDMRVPNVQVERAFHKGWFEVQDEGSQIVSELIFARPGEKILDFCAGAGGKTLAMGAAMDNKGQIFAHDSDRTRLARIRQRIQRSGLHNVQVRESCDGAVPADLVGQMDRVVLDVPCTGSGTWRRRPDAKWRLTRQLLDQRLDSQAAILSQAVCYVRVGGYLIYITCSVFREENEGQVYAFLERNSDFELVSAGEVWQELYGSDRPKPWSSDLQSVTLTPASTGTDGFYFAVMQKIG